MKILKMIRGFFLRWGRSSQIMQLSPISGHVIIHLGGNSCAIFAHQLMHGSIRKQKKNLPRKGIIAVGIVSKVAELRHSFFLYQFDVIARRSYEINVKHIIYNSS